MRLLERTFPRDSLSIPGQWTIDITARRPESYDSVASFQLNYPKEIDESRVSGDQRQFGSFEAVVTGIALASLVVALILYRFSAKLNSRSADVDMRRGLSESGFRMINSLGAGLSTALLISLVVWVAHGNVLKTEFQKLCENNNGVWTQSTPMRGGTVLSSNTMTGCTAGGGADHFADFREYSYFLHQPAVPDHQHHH
jgi:hypothetical protein